MKQEIALVMLTVPMMMRSPRNLWVTMWWDFAAVTRCAGLRHGPTCLLPGQGLLYKMQSIMPEIYVLFVKGLIFCSRLHLQRQTAAYTHHSLVDVFGRTYWEATGVSWWPLQKVGPHSCPPGSSGIVKV